MEALAIEPLHDRDEAVVCARMMAGSDPWLTLGRGFEECLRAIEDPSREVHVARSGDAVRGFIILNLHGALVGYLQTICVAADARGSGVGSTLMAFAEERVFAVSPNIFLCVSSFNRRAKALYERLGYQTIGELRDYLVPGQSEWLMRKTIGPLQGFRPAARARDHASS